MIDRQTGQRLYAEAAGRVAEMDLEACRDAEIAALKRLRIAGPPEARELLRDLRDRPLDEGWRDRCLGTLRRIYREMLEKRVDADTCRVGLHAYLDRRVETAERWLTADLLIRPWGHD